MKRRALLSVSDQSGLVEFARGLAELNFEIIATGGTKKTLEKAGIEAISVDSITGFPECFSGRVKTMHPAITGAVLYRRDDKEHAAQASDLAIEPIDVVAVNLYPFEKALEEGNSPRAELIELIDIGGPTLLRSAAKNHDSVTVICDPSDYDRVLEELKSNGDTSRGLREELAAKVFLRTASYDAAIVAGLTEEKKSGLMLTGGIQLRYGENPHQWGKYYEHAGHDSRWKILQEEKQMSYLNLLDADGAWNLVIEIPEPAAACIKHANPSGVAADKNIDDAFQKSYDTDRLSAFGVIIALNRICTVAIVQKIIDQKIFAEIIVAPGYEPEAVELLKQKPKIRVIEMYQKEPLNEPIYRSVLGGILIQNQDVRLLTSDDLTCVTELKPSEKQIEDLLFAWHVVKHAKSNAIVLAKDKVSVGIGCGQTSRVDSTTFAAQRAGERARGSVLASDAFFPFADSIERAAEHGIAAIIQPGGSIRDDEVIAKANELGIPMIFTGVRAFRH